MESISPVSLTLMNSSCFHLFQIPVPQEKGKKKKNSFHLFRQLEYFLFSKDLFISNHYIRVIVLADSSNGLINWMSRTRAVDSTSWSFSTASSRTFPRCVDIRGRFENSRLSYKSVPLMYFPACVVVFLLFILLSETDRDFTASGLFLLLSDGSQSSVNLSYVRIWPSHLYISFFSLYYLASSYFIFFSFAYPHGRLFSLFFCFVYLFIYLFFCLKK